MFRARLRARLCRGKEGLHRAPTFVRQFGGYTHHLLLFLSSTHYCPLFHPLLSEIYPLFTTLRPSKGGLKRQSLLQTWCGSAPRRGPSANGYDAWRFGSESDFCGRDGRWKGLIFRHNRVLVQNQGTVLKKSSHRGVHPGHFPSREGENERRPISCAHSSWIKRSTLLCRIYKQQQGKMMD